MVEKNWKVGKKLQDEQFNTYMIEKIIGTGGFGITYLARHELTERLVVIKTINQNRVETNNYYRKKIEESIIKEWRELSRIKHESIVKAENLFERDGSWCILMEYIEGKNLKEYIEGHGFLSEEEALKSIRQIGRALIYLHEKHNLLHRDIKPSNIMLCKNQKTSRVVLIDFGTARYFADSQTVSHTRTFTSGYAPYEQYVGDDSKIGWTLDVYALAATLYFLLTAKVPVSTEERVEKEIELEPPNHYNPKISDRVNEAILRGMELVPEDRPQSVREWLNMVLSPSSENRINFDTNPEYSFVTETLNRGKTFYFTRDEMGELRKLGDGSYGVVYQGHDDENNIYAIKILYERYENSSEKSIAQARFKAEIQSSKDIRTNLGYPNQIIGVINNLAGTKQFKQSPAYRTLQAKYKVLGLSNYALVMEKFDGTLEDYLEQGIGKYAIQHSENIRYTYLERKVFNSSQQAVAEIDKEVKSEREKIYLKQKIYELTGYDLLRRMDFKERIANILPYLQDIAQGLNTLHKASYLHLDLKPANIFIRGFGKDVQAVIGDLGFLEQGKLDPKLLLGNYEVLPLGTRHFQSPEQKEVFDIANVEISDDPDRKLIIKDPKFRDSIIEEGDYVIFSRNRKKAYGIKSVKIQNNFKNYPVHITLELSEEEKENFKPGDVTQAFFFKVQGKRTDLFGFGAIAFNLLTCGESPVRFYESIHSSYDTRNSRVDSLIKYYEQVYSFQSSEPVIIKIFEPFKDKNSTEYAPIPIVELILKCMLYKAENTFYFSSRENQEPTEIVLNQIISFHQPEEGYYPMFDFKRTENALLNRKLESSQTSEEKDFLEQLKVLHTLSGEQFALRLAQGFWYIRHLAKLIESHLENNSDFYFAELTPKNIVIKNSNKSSKPESLDTKYVVYKNVKSYESDVRNDLLFTKIAIRNYQENPYVPAFFSGMRRDIILEKFERDINRNLYRYKYHFSDRYESKVYLNDWIVIKLINQPQNFLFKVVRIDERRIIDLSPVLPDFETGNDEWDLNFDANLDSNPLTRCVYYRSIDPCIYYLHMLGIYMYDIFFLGWEGNDYELIQKIYDRVSTDLYFISLKNFKGRLNIRQFEEQSDPKKQSSLLNLIRGERENQSSQQVESLKKILTLLAQMYLKLTFSSSVNSYYLSFNKDSHRIGAVLGDLDRLKDKIAEFLKIQGAQLESLISENNLEISSELSTLLNSEEVRKFAPFHKLISSQYEIESRSDQSG